MKMKFIKNIFVASTAVLAMSAFTACDYLDIEPENKVPEENVDFTKIENMYEPVSGCYAKIRTSNMHWVINLMTNTRDGDIWSGRVDDQGEIVNFDKYVYNASFWGLNEMWSQYYNIIRVCNAAIQSLDSYAENITSDTDMKKYLSYSGEVRTLRALAYYRLTQMFGDVSIMHSNTQSSLRRSTREVVYEYILTDLEFAMTNTPKVRPNQMEHVGAASGFTAEALAAKVCMDKGDYQKALEYTNEIITSNLFELYPDYYQLFKLPGRLCNESLLECQVTDFGIGDGDYVGVDQFFNCCGPKITNSTTAVASASGWNFMGYKASFVKWAEDRGETVRATTTFLKGGETTPSGDFVQAAGNPSNTNCWNGKYYLPLEQMTAPRNTYGSPNNVRILRYADVLLMNAEAKVRLGQNGDAPFNKVRTRAQMPTLSGVTVDQILDERRMELCGEWANRLTDLIRTGKAATVLASQGYTPEKAYFPVPSSQSDVSTELKLEPLTTLEEALGQQ